MTAMKRFGRTAARVAKVAVACWMAMSLLGLAAQVGTEAIENGLTLPYGLAAAAAALVTVGVGKLAEAIIDATSGKLGD